MWLDGYPGTEAAFVEQRVVIPEGEPVLRFRLWNGARERPQDVFELSVDDTRLLELAPDPFRGGCARFVLKFENPFSLLRIGTCLRALPGAGAAA